MNTPYLGSEKEIGFPLDLNEIYLVKDLAYITGYSVDTIKYYLKIGLVKEIGKTPRTNFRYFNESTVTMLNKIRHLRTEGKSIAQIKEILKEEKVS